MDDRTPLHQNIDLPDGSGRLIVFDWSVPAARPRYHNLIRLNAAGAVVWTAELPSNTTPDCVVSVRMDGCVIRANTWSGWLVTLDGQTGKIFAASVK